MYWHLLRTASLFYNWIGIIMHCPDTVDSPFLSNEAINLIPQNRVVTNLVLAGVSIRNLFYSTPWTGLSRKCAISLLELLTGDDFDVRLTVCCPQHCLEKSPFTHPWRKVYARLITPDNISFSQCESVTYLLHIWLAEYQTEASQLLSFWHRFYKVSPIAIPLCLANHQSYARGPSTINGGFANRLRGQLGFYHS